MVKYFHSRLTSVGLAVAANPGLLAISLKLSHRPGGRLPFLFARLAVVVAWNNKRTHRKTIDRHSYT